MDDTDIHEIVATMDPHDGFGVQAVDVAGRHTLYAVFRADGVFDPQMPWTRNDVLGAELWHGEGDGVDVAADQLRTHALAEAMCRFLSTGGTTAQIKAVAERMHRSVPPGMVVGIDGYHLADSALNTDGVYEHVYAPDAPGQEWCVRVVERSFVDVVPRRQVLAELEEANLEPEWEWDADGGGGQGDEGGRRALPDRPGDGAEGEA